jgi:simple sugar transport system permease protein
VANFTGIAMGMLLKVTVDGEGQLMWYAIPAVIAAGCCMGAACGLFNGLLISKVPIPPILATLGTFELFTGISVIITNGKAVAKLPARYAEALAGRLGPIPVQAVIFIIIAIAVGVLLSSTSYGLKIYMLGTSERAARFSGLRVNRLLLQTYMISGVCAAVGGLIMLANYNTARADFGLVYTLQCVLIVVLGGVSPKGGKGKLTGVLLSICMLQLLSSGLNRFPQINSFYIPLIWGGVLIFIMVLDYFTDKANYK